MTEEYVLWGRKPNEAEWQEQVLATKNTEKQLEPVIKRFEADGFVGLRVAHYVYGKSDFESFSKMCRGEK